MQCVAVFVFIMAAVAAVLARPQFQQQYIPQSAAAAPALHRAEVHDNFGQFAYNYQTRDGFTRDEQGALKRTQDGRDNVLVFKGSYTYISPEGIPLTVHYTADENGFRPSGAHIPTPAPPSF